MGSIAWGEVSRYTNHTNQTTIQSSTTSSNCSSGGRPVNMIHFCVLVCGAYECRHHTSLMNYEQESSEKHALRLLHATHILNLLVICFATLFLDIKLSLSRANRREYRHEQPLLQCTIHLHTSPWLSRRRRLTGLLCPLSQ